MARESTLKRPVSIWQVWRKKRYFWILGSLGPPVLLFLVIRAFPILETIRLSFFRYHITRKSRPFVGLTNYLRLLEDSAFQTAFVNTIQFTFFAVIITLFLALFLAIFLRSIDKASPLFEIIFYIPVVTPWVPASVIWKWIYDPMYGVLNYFLSLLGIPRVGWLQQPGTVLYAIVGVSVWKMLGYFMVVYGVGLKNIPDMFMEAAEIDGATPWQRLMHIVLPLMRPIILFSVVMSTIIFFNVFAPVYVLTASAQGAPAYDLKVMVTEIYRYAFKFYKMGYAGAFSVVLLIFVMIMILLQFSLFREKE
jgi:multiple sugar transport system permease protein